VGVQGISRIGPVAETKAPEPSKRSRSTRLRVAIQGWIATSGNRRTKGPTEKRSQPIPTLSLPNAADRLGIKDSAPLVEVRGWQGHPVGAPGKAQDALGRARALRCRPPGPAFQGAGGIGLPIESPTVGFVLFIVGRYLDGLGEVDPRADQ
jgi:hypothetical protein